MRRTITRRLRPYAAACLVLLMATAASAQAPGPRPSEDPFARGAWALELRTHGALETWNYNTSHEEMLSISTGVTRGIGRGVAVKVGTELYHVWQRSTDGWLFGLTFGVRSRVVKRPSWSLFWEFEVGLSEADTIVPPGGTRFNYLALGGGGVAIRLRADLHAVAGLRWVHVSNNGREGRSRNPDIEAVGPVLGLVVGF